MLSTRPELFIQPITSYYTLKANRTRITVRMTSGAIGLNLTMPSEINVPQGDLKSTIDKTVDYILKNGDAFENRLKQSDKFPFIYSNNEFYDYFQWKLGRYLPSNTGENSLDEPPPLNFVVEKSNVSPIDYEVLKLTALFTARNGEQYLKQLHTHEINRGFKSQFEFINKNHSLNLLFMSLVDQYKRVLNILTHNDVNDFDPDLDLFKDAYKRAIHCKQNKQQAKAQKNLDKERRLQYASIDWQDFTIVGNIEFTDVDQVVELPEPLNRQDLVFRSLQDKTKDLDLVPIPVSPKPIPSTIEPTSSTTDSKEPQPSDSDRLPFKGKIRAAGESRLKKRTKELTIICPITQKPIPELEFDQHLKVLLKNPNFSQERDNYIKKNFKYSSNLTNDEVFENIKRLSRKKPRLENFN